VAKPSYSQPAEWQPHSHCWLAFPYSQELWGAHLACAQAEFRELVRTICKSEQVCVLVPDTLHLKLAQELLPLPVQFFVVPFGDIWMRDIAPIFVTDPSKGAIAAHAFQWNGWGHKYLLPGDEGVAQAVAQLAGVPLVRFDFVLEGGAVEVDGLGTCLTTKQCLLNPNRNPHLSQAEIEQKLRTALGVSHVLWLEAGLRNDHTDGHIDTIARFVAPHTVMCMLTDDRTDPNYRVLRDIHEQLRGLRDATDTPLRVVTIPSPHTVLNDRGELLPASYLNFYIANEAVIVPTYGVAHDRQAVAEIAKFFGNRQTVGLPAWHILLGGGAFHCITQQQPALRKDGT
jgi:agmatine deiminase